MKRNTSLVVLVAVAFTLLSLAACNSNNDDNQSATENETYIAEWEDRKYSMFIHWGLYSIPAGVWNGKQIKGYSEQIKGHANIPTDQYRRLATQFNPTQWSADSVAALAQRAGMKSIVITSKHHDGFCLFGSEYTQFDVIDATPYKKDILKELSEACQRYGLKFGVYFSLIDWDYQGALPFTSVRNSDSIPPAHHQYNLNQVKELLTNYGEISEIWFDMGAPTLRQSIELKELVKELQPTCLVSGRIWNDQGDFVVMGDNKKPEYKMGVPWQTPASMFDETWSYRSWQQRTQPETKAAEKLHDLLTVVSSGGNYLLNIGPKADGSIVYFEQQVLEEIGSWLAKNGEAVYATTVSPITPQTWGVITEKPQKLFLHITHFPANNRIVIAGLKNNIAAAYLLTDNTALLTANTTNDGVEVTLPANIKKDKYATVVVLEYTETLNYISPRALQADEQATFTLTAANTDSVHSYTGHDYYSTKPTLVKMTWNLVAPEEKEYVADIALYTTKEQNYVMKINEKDVLLSKDEIKEGILVKKVEIGKLKNNTNNHITLNFDTPTNPNEDLGLEKVNIQLKEK